MSDAAYVAVIQRDHPRALTYCDQALAVSRAQGFDDLTFLNLLNGAMHAYWLDDMEAARRAVAEALRLASGIGFASMIYPWRSADGWRCAPVISPTPRD